MKKMVLVAFAFVLFSQTTMAQTVKTGVLIIGNGSAALGAGIQSAMSGAKTTLLIQEPEFVLAPLEQNIHSGLEADFLKRMRKAKGIKDPGAPVYLDQTSANAVIKRWTDSVKNLTLISHVKWSRIKRSGGGWNVLLSNGKAIKAAVLVNADQTGNVAATLGLPIVSASQWHPFSYVDQVYKNSTGSGASDSGSSINYTLLKDFQVAEQENLLLVNTRTESIIAGQAVGAAAAYAAFFDTKTSKVNLKMTQAELIKFRLSLVPFTDVPNVDSNWVAIQYIGLSGFLKGEIANGKLSFLPEQAVTTAEIRDMVKAYYYKAQIWFEDYKAEDMTIQSTLNLVCFVGNKSPEHTQAEVMKKWKPDYGFKNDFDLKRKISRREFAVLVNAYLKPFDVNIDASGRVIR
jgi:hypothetical protein